MENVKSTNLLTPEETERNIAKYGPKDDDNIARAYKESKYGADFFCYRNATKYLRRFCSQSEKAGNVMDIKKAADYITRMVEATNRFDGLTDNITSELLEQAYRDSKAGADFHCYMLICENLHRYVCNSQDAEDIHCLLRARDVVYKMLEKNADNIKAEVVETTIVKEGGVTHTVAKSLSVNK